MDDASGVLSVVPAGGTQGVDPSRPVVVRFNRSMMSGMEMLVVLHERTIDGPAVAGSYAWSTDRTTLTFTPAARLAARSQYVLHLAPDLRTASGERLNHGACVGLGGRSVTGSMMTSSAMSRAGMGSGMMGREWIPIRGSHGMMFLFVTS
ncbi:MAG: Ig-like domain-containing protein [Gemmatimonadetes bacterium]|nr:Ig-like domain-containing protein [Gemmatimonadota bacterium]